MKLICLEEHVMDYGIAQATARIQEENAPYFRETSPQGLPAYAAPDVGTDMGEGRLADMDANGIDIFLDHERYAPILAKAAELQVPLYLHPGFPVKEVQEAYYAGLDPLLSARLSAFGWGWHAEVGVHIIRMILAGLFDRYPDLQIIAGHWGEMVPFFLDRLDAMLPQSITHLNRSITETFIRHVYVTPSGMYSWPQFQFILQVVGADRILYSVDYPYIENKGAREFLENAAISQYDKEKIGYRNAEKLLKIH